MLTIRIAILPILVCAAKMLVFTSDI